MLGFREIPRPDLGFPGAGMKGLDACCAAFGMLSLAIQGSEDKRNSKESFAACSTPNLTQSHPSLAFELHPPSATRPLAQGAGPDDPRHPERPAGAAPPLRLEGGHMGGGLQVRLLACTAAAWGAAPECVASVLGQSPVQPAQLTSPHMHCVSLLCMARAGGVQPGPRGLVHPPRLPHRA